MKQGSINIAAITSALAFILTAFLNWGDYTKTSWPNVIGSLLGGGIGIWGLAGISLFFSSPENKLRNWCVTLAILAAFIWFGRLDQKDASTHSSKTVMTIQSKATGRTYKVEFDRVPTEEDIDEAAAFFDAQDTVNPTSN